MKCKYCRNEIAKVGGKWEESTGMLRAICPEPGTHTHHVPEAAITDRAALIEGVFESVIEFYACDAEYSEVSKDKLETMSDEELTQFALNLLQDVGRSTGSVGPVPLTVEVNVGEHWTDMEETEVRRDA